MMHGIFKKSLSTNILLDNIISHGCELVLNQANQTVATYNDSHCWLAQALERDAASQTLETYHSDRYVITAWASLYNREELRERLQISAVELLEFSDAKLILKLWLLEGENCTQYLNGDFAFAIYNTVEKSLFCARDQMGIKPFYYYNDDNVFVFSSSMILFHKLPGLSIKPCTQWMSRYLILPAISMSFEKTAYENIYKLSPAHQLIVGESVFIKRKYFSFHTEKFNFKRTEDYVDCYHEALDRAIQSRVQVPHPLGTESSGGMDSSTVTVYAAKHYPGKINNFHTFSFANYQDEPSQILSINQKLRIPMGFISCNISSFEYETNWDLRVIGAPHQHGNSVSHAIFYDKASLHGVKTLLSGFGGDEFTTSIHAHLYLEELFINKQYWQLYRNFKGGHLERFLRFLKFVYLRMGDSGVKNTSMINAYNERWSHNFLNKEYLQKYALKEIFDEHGSYDYGYDNLDKFTLEKRLAPVVSTRTEESCLMAGSYGIEYRWPLLDIRLIQTFLSIPSQEKYYRGQGRYLHRRAIAKHVPPNIVMQNSKNMGKRISKSEFGVKVLKKDLHPMLAKLINFEKIREQEYYIKKCNSQSSKEDPRYYLFVKNIMIVNAIDSWLKYKS